MIENANKKWNRTPASPPSVVITGTSSGIGRATALALSTAGYRVFAGVRRPADAADLLRRADGRDGGQLIPMILDVTDTASITEAADVVGRLVGADGIAALINNAGIGMTGPVEAILLDDLRWVYEVNVFGQVAVSQAFLPLLRNAGGRMVNIGSIGDRLSLPFGAPLASSKWAIASITESLRLELRPWGIQVVLIEPASIHTDAVHKVETDAERVLREMSDTNRALYAESYRSMTRRALAQERDGSEPDVVARAVLRALSARRPRTRYIVGKDARLLAFVARWAPDRLFDRIRIKLFDLPKKFGAARATLSPAQAGAASEGVVR